MENVKIKHPLIFMGSFIFATVFAWILCRDWFFFALMLFAPYYMGGFRFLPYKTVRQKMISIGFFMGFLLGICIFLKCIPS